MKSKWTEVTLFRCGCPHCDAAERELRSLAKRHGVVLSVRRVENDPDLKSLAGWRTPVVCVNGRQVTHYEVSAKKWEAAIRGELGAAPTMLVGEVVDMACYMKKGLKGEDHRKCAEACIQEGVPLGLATRSGELYLLVEDHSARDAYRRLAELAAEQVRVTGDVYERGGVHAVVVRAVESAR
ncbi:MAG: glutaredoxin family protein [Elusimicrobia bacterium]|nr:glutaredoxin family protein [Elusimicrobiota bacterium]